MSEQKNNLPEEYIIEALKIKDQFDKQFKEYLNSIKNRDNMGRDYSSKEERRINLEFRQALDNLKLKYNIS